MPTSHERLKYSEIQAFRLSMYHEQKGACPVCGHHISLDYAVLDHDHVSGHIRAVLHSDCNVLLGKIENLITHKGKRMATEGRVEGALEGIWEYMIQDYSHNPWHPKHKTATDKERLRLTKLYKRSKKQVTKDKYRKLIEELT